MQSFTDSNYPQINSSPDLIPARMLNEFAFCPRLCHLEWVQQEWEDNEWTLDGTFQHRRVDQPGGNIPVPEEMEKQAEETIHARSVMLSAPESGFIAKMDLIEAESGQVIPVEYKRGSIPDTPERSWEPERVQLCAQALTLAGKRVYVYYRCSLLCGIPAPGGNSYNGCADHPHVRTGQGLARDGAKFINAASTQGQSPNAQGALSWGFVFRMKQPIP